MKIRTVIDPEGCEEIVIYSRSETDLGERIEALLSEGEKRLFGYRNGEIVPILSDDVDAFVIEEGRTVAVMGVERLRVRGRLYELEEAMSDSFVKINQSCLVNISRISRCRAGFGGSLMVIMRGGFSDYVSRRQMKEFKKRMDF